MSRRGGSERSGNAGSSGSRGGGGGGVRRTTTTCLYSVLGVSEDASEQDIRRAYRALSLRYHPDKNPESREEAEEMFKQIAEAYSVLSDPQTRAEYDNRARYADGRGGAGAAAAGGGGGFEHFRFRQRNLDPFAIFEEFFAGQRRNRSGSGFGGSAMDAFFGGHDLFDVHDMGRGMGGFGRLFDEMRAMESMMLGGHREMQPQQHLQVRQHGDGAMMMSHAMGGGGGGFFGGSGSSSSTSTQTIVRNGERITRTTRTVVGPDGSVQTQTEEHRDQLDDRHARGGGGGGDFVNFYSFGALR